MEKTKFDDTPCMGEILATCTCTVALTTPPAKTIYCQPVNGVDIHEITWPPKDRSNEPK